MKKLLIMIIAVSVLGYTYQTAQAPTGQFVSNYQAKRYYYIRCMDSIPNNTKFWNQLAKECDTIADNRSKEWKPL